MHALDKWLHKPLPDRSIPIEKSYVEHAYPILQRKPTSVPLSINLANDQPTKISHQSNYVVNFVQNNEISKPKPSMPLKDLHSHSISNNFQTEQVLYKKYENIISNLFFNCLE